MRRVQRGVLSSLFNIYLFNGKNNRNNPFNDKTGGRMKGEKKINATKQSTRQLIELLNSNLYRLSLVSSIMDPKLVLVHQEGRKV